MSKEYLKAFEIVYNNFDYLVSDVVIENDDVNICLKTIKEQLPAIKQALQRLEAIDNANPSEALECLEKLKGMEISCMPFSDEYGTQEVDLNDIRKFGSQLNTDFREYTATIQQALLKTQKPKHYLKWEDLEKFEEQKDFFALLNGNKYTLCRYRDSRNKYVMVNLNEINIATLCDMFKQDIDFFNDLHLERVEE